VLLAPTGAAIPKVLGPIRKDWAGYAHLLGEAQRLRGRLYLEDGAIGAHELTDDGRFIVPGDSSSWHILTIQDGRVTACSRYTDHGDSATFDRLGLRASALAASDVWGAKLRSGVEQTIAKARAHGLSIVEVGGWAVCESLRFTTEALRVACGTFALAQLLGGCIGFTTATVRNCSSRILRKLGGSPCDLGGTGAPRYFDPRYGCEMEILQFNSDSPNDHYGRFVDEMKAELAMAHVVTPQAPSRMLQMPLPLTLTQELEAIPA
jgi:hypothetical protein